MIWTDLESVPVPRYWYLRYRTVAFDLEKQIFKKSAINYEVTLVLIFYNANANNEK